MEALTGQLLYEAYRAQAQDEQYPVPAWEDAIRVHPRFNGIAERLNQQLRKHQTQPLPEQERPYQKQFKTFRSLGVEDDPCASVDEQINRWLEEHPGVVIYGHAHTMNVGAAGADQFIVSLLVELPAEEDKDAAD